MFKLSQHKILIKDLHKVVNNKVVLYSDDENDILYTGTNSYGNKILGVIIGEDEDEGFLRYFHILISDNQYYDFLGQKISLLDLLKYVESFFVIDFDYNYIELRHSYYPFEEFPNEFLPLNNSYCPEFIKEPSFEYVISLKGKTSDNHLIYPNDLNEVNLKFSNFLKDSTEFVQELNLERQVFVESLRTGSFQIKFKLSINSPNQVSIFSSNTKNLENFLKNFYSYIFEKLPNEKPDVFFEETISSEDFISIKNELENVYNDVDIEHTDLGIEQKVIDTISNSINNLKELNFDSSFDRIEFKNISKKGEEIPISLIEKDFMSTVENKFPKSGENLEEDIIRIDETPQKYKIQVYLFNTDSGNGSSYIQTSDDSIDRVPIHIRGKEDYKNTIFTKSMDDGKIIEIEGIGKWVNNKIKLITFQY